MFRKLKSILLLPLAAVIVLVLVAFGPIKRIRLGRIGSARIGHFVTAVETYLCKAEAGILAKPSSCADVFLFEEYICNHEIGKQWRKYVRVFPFPQVANIVAWILSKFESLSKHHLIPPEETSPWGLPTERAIRRFRGHLTIPDDVVRAGDAFSSNTAHGKPIVCFHARDSSYLRHTQPGFDSSYHDYRDWRADTLIPTVETLSNLGFFLVRMGAVVDKAFPFVRNNIFDYARSDLRSDQMDLYFASRCTFWIGSASGLMDVPFVFRRPLVVVNYVCPLIPADPRITMYENSLWTFKKYWSEKENRFLTFREILETGAGSIFRSSDFKAAGIRLVDNSPEEIRDVALEMVERLNGTWIETAEDEKLQSRFWAVWGESAYARALEANVRVGARFLSKNLELLS